MAAKLARPPHPTIGRQADSIGPPEPQRVLWVPGAEGAILVAHNGLDVGSSVPPGDYSPARWSR